MASPQIEVLETLALQLHREVKRHGVKAALAFFRTFVVPAGRNTTGLLPTAKNKNVLYLFVAVCEKMNLFSPIVITYMNTVSNLVKAAGQLRFTLRLLDNKSAARFLEYAVEKREWEFAWSVLHSKPRMQTRSVLGTLTKKTFHRDPFPITQIVLKRGHICEEILINFVFFLIKAGNKHLFEFIVKNHLISLSEVVKVNPSYQNRDIIVSALSTIVQSLETVKDEQDRRADDILSIAMETGLSTYYANLTLQNQAQKVKSPMSIATQKCRLDIVGLLYRTGATTNAQLFHLKGSLDDHKVNTEKDQTTEEIDRYVYNATQHPRRLQELCLLRVSHCIGCRDPDSRYEAVNKISLLAQECREDFSDDMNIFTIQDRVLFTDVILDFMHGTSYRAVDRDPPGVWLGELENISSEDGTTNDFFSEELEVD